MPRAHTEQGHVSPSAASDLGSQPDRAGDDDRADSESPSIRARVRATPGGRLAWRVGVTVLGVATIAGGIILLPLPGPGWVIIFAGLGVLATEYTWAARLLTWARDQVSGWTAWLKRQSLWVRVLVVVATALVVVAAVGAAWLLLR